MLKYLLALFLFLTLPLTAETSALAITPQALEKAFKEHITFNPNGPNQIGHILIDDRTSGISESTWLYVKQALDYYKKTKPAFIILELNTPGGEVFAAQKISDALKNMDTQESIPVITFVNNWAISAGAMLAYSSRFIAATKDAAMGAAEPVVAGETGEMKSASEKVNSAIRADMENRARFFDRNPYIALAMVDKDVTLVIREGKITLLDSDSQIRPDDTVISPKGKLLTLNGQQMIDYGVADFMVMPAKLSPITPEEKAAGKWPASKMLLFQQPFLASIPQATVDSYRMDWKTQFFVFLAHPVVSSLLMLGLMVGFYFEMSSPGIGLAGTVAFVCLFLIILSTLSLEIASWLEVILLLTGLGIILIELFVLPTFGLLGIVGVIMAVAGLFGMLLPEIGSVRFDYDTQTLNAAGEAFVTHLAWLCGTILVGFVLIAILARYVTPSLTAWSRLVLTGSEQEASQGYIAGAAPSQLPPVGKQGQAFTMLRPAGKVLINDNIYDAVADGGFIEKDLPIVVKRLDGSVIVVDRIEELP